MNKKLKVIFAISLAINILLVGFLAGKGCSMIKPDHRSKSMEDKIVRILPQEKQKQAFDVLKQLKEARKNSFKQNKVLFDEVEVIVKAKDFDKEKFLSAMNKVSSSMNQAKSNSDQVLADFLITLTQDERANLVKEFKKMHQFGKDSKHRGEENCQKKGSDQPRKGPRLER